MWDLDQNEIETPGWPETQIQLHGVNPGADELQGGDFDNTRLSVTWYEHSIIPLYQNKSLLLQSHDSKDSMYEETGLIFLLRRWNGHDCPIWGIIQKQTGENIECWDALVDFPSAA